MIEDVCIVNGEWVAVTGWYEPDQKPVRVGWFESEEDNNDRM